MIVYHGSDSNFKKLRVSKDLVKHRNGFDNEGLGIYFSTDVEVAKHYGKYIYTLEVNDNYFIDFRDTRGVVSYISKLEQLIEKEVGINIIQYFNVELVMNVVCSGALPVSLISQEIYSQLHSNLEWRRLQRPEDKIYNLFKLFSKDSLKVYMYSYNIPNTGVKKDVSDDVVRIVSKQKWR